MSKDFKYMNEKLISNDDRIFVAGSKGMAGSAICRKLIEKGYGSKINKGSLLCPTRSDLDLSDIINLHGNETPQINYREGRGMFKTGALSLCPRSFLPIDSFSKISCSFWRSLSR